MSAATKRLSAITMQEKLDKLASDVSMPIPDMGLARLLSSIFNVLGLGFILLGAIALFFALQPQQVNPNPTGTTTALSEMGQMFGSSRAALLLASLLGIMGGATIMLVGATVSMIADIRVETAHNRQMLAAILESNLRPYNPNMKAPTQQYIVQIPPSPSPTSESVSTPAELPPSTQDTDPVSTSLISNTKSVTDKE